MSSVSGGSTAVLAFAGALVATAALGYPMLAWLRRAGVRQSVSEDAPERHAAKQGTPTMGGLIMGAGLLVAAGCLAASGRLGADDLVVLGLVATFGAIGFADDRLIVRRGRNLGLTARQKLLLQFAAAAGFGLWLMLARGAPEGTQVCGVQLGLWYYPACALLIVGLSNATNLADGLDGLSAGMSLIAFLALGVMSPIGGHGRPVCNAAFLLAGACAGLLWFNANPALIFMGNTGALALGAGLAGAGVLWKVEAPLQLAAAMFWIETISVMAQVAVFKWRKRRNGIEYARSHRLLRRAPLHHHFEEVGWPETRIVARFWLLGGVAATLAVVWVRSGLG